MMGPHLDFMAGPRFQAELALVGMIQERRAAARAQQLCRRVMNLSPILVASSAGASDYRSIHVVEHVSLGLVARPIRFARRALGLQRVEGELSIAARWRPTVPDRGQLVASFANKTVLPFAGVMPTPALSSGVSIFRPALTQFSFLSATTTT
jgi:hypothetical protein